MKLVKVSDGTHKLLMKRAGEKQKQIGRRVTLDEVIRDALSK